REILPEPLRGSKLHVGRCAMKPGRTFARHAVSWTLMLVGLLVAPTAASGRLVFIQVQTDGIDGVDGLERVQAGAVSSDGSSVYAVSFFDNALAAFGRNTTTGLLTFVEVKRNTVDRGGL